MTARARSLPAIVTFFALSFAWTWILWAISSLIQMRASDISPILFLLSGFGPSLAALAVVSAFGNSGDLRGWLRQCLRWRVGWRWYAIALLAPPIIMVAALGTHALLGGAIPPSSLSGYGLIAVAQFGLVILVGGPLGEEFGWRGYALPALAERLGWRHASLIIGAVWAFWHVPLFYIAGTAQADLPMAWFLASTVALSVIFARLSVNTDFSVIPAILLHSAINWWSMALPIMPKAGNERVYELAVMIMIAVALALLLLPGPKKIPEC